MGDDWNKLCTQEALHTTNKLIARPNHAIPPLLSSAEFVSVEAMNTSDTKTTPISEDKAAEMPYPLSLEPQHSNTSNSDQESLSSSKSAIEFIPATSSSSIQIPDISESDSSQGESQSKNDDETQTVSEFLPDKTYYYNSKNSYIFPGAELWWKDSDNESVSSDSSSGDDDDVDDIEIDNIRNELEQSYVAPENSQLNSTYDTFFTNEQTQKEHDFSISSSSCSSNHFENTADSGIIKSIEYKLTSSTVTPKSTTTLPSLPLSTAIITTITAAPALLSPNATTSHGVDESKHFRKRSASTNVDILTAFDTIEATDIENVQKRMKLSNEMLMSANSINSNDEISKN